MKSLLFAVVTLVSLNSFASVENVRCRYTEPFIKASVDLGSKSIIVHELGTDSVKSEKIRSIDIVNGVITYSSKNTTLVVDTTKLGNDGMSDEMMDYDSHITVGQFGVYGGCNKVSE